MKSFEAFALLAIGAMVGTALTMAMLGMAGYFWPCLAAGVLCAVLHDSKRNKCS